MEDPKKSTPLETIKSTKPQNPVTREIRKNTQLSLYRLGKTEKLSKTRKIQFHNPDPGVHR